MYDVIYRLEEIAMEKAMVNVTAEAIANLENVIQAQEQAVEEKNIEVYYDLNEKFHSFIFLIASNKVLSEMYSSLRRSARPFRMISMAQGDNLQSSLAEHKKQAKALMEKDMTSGKRAIHEQEIRSIASLDILFPE
nr:FCD domain-containing protein [Cytobacillus horneckiae]